MFFLTGFLNHHQQYEHPRVMHLDLLEQKFDEKFKIRVLQKNICYECLFGVGDYDDTWKLPKTFTITVELCTKISPK